MSESHIGNNSNLSTSSNRSSKLAKKQYDCLFKIVLIGDSGVGKSCILLRFADDQFNESFHSTIGVDFRFKCVSIEGKEIKLQIWDTAGQERFKTITSAYYRGADAIILVCDLTDKNSFYNLHTWLEDVNKLTTDNPVKLILANKSDLEERSISKSEISEFTNKTGIEIIECSALSSYHINYAFETISYKLLKIRYIFK